MATIKMNKNELYFVSDNDEKKLLLDYREYYHNLGTIPLHCLGRDEIVTIPALIQTIYSEYTNVANRIDKPMDITSLLLITSYIINQSMLGYRPLKILDMCYCHGLLSLVLMKLSSILHPDSQIYVFLENAFDEALQQSSGSYKNLNLISTNLDSDIFREDYFDVTVIDASLVANNLSQIIKNALRITCGYVILLVEENSWDREVILTSLGDHDEYEISNNSSVIIKKATNHITVNNDKLSNLGAIIKSIAYKEFSRENVTTIISILCEMEKAAIEGFNIQDINVKNRINQAKENALNFLYSTSEKFKELCEKQLRLLISSI